MAYISNKDKKYLEKKEIEEKNSGKNPDYRLAPKDPSKSKVWKVLNLFLIALMVILPIACVIALIIQAAKN